MEKYLWGGLTQLLAVYDGSNNLLMRFEYADGRMPVSMTRSGSTYYLSYDQVGTLRSVCDSTGAIVKRVDYDSFGNIITDTAPAFAMPFGFAGGLHDRDTGLVHFGYRDYDPAAGRWTAKDPIGFAGGDVNVYGYCLEDPVNWVDPLGLMTAKELLTYSDGWLTGFGDGMLEQWIAAGTFWSNAFKGGVEFGATEGSDADQAGKFGGCFAKGAVQWLTGIGLGSAASAGVLAGTNALIINNPQLLRFMPQKFVKYVLESNGWENGSMRATTAARGGWSRIFGKGPQFRIQWSAQGGRHGGSYWKFSGQNNPIQRIPYFLDTIK